MEVVSGTNTGGPTQINSVARLDTLPDTKIGSVRTMVVHGVTVCGVLNNNNVASTLAAFPGRAEGVPVGSNMHNFAVTGGLYGELATVVDTSVHTPGTRNRVFAHPVTVSFLLAGGWVVQSVKHNPILAEGRAT